MGEAEQLRVQRKVILIDPIQLDLYIRRQRAASPCKEEHGMSRKERIQAFKVLLDLIRRHEGEWTREKLIAEFSFRYGYTQKKTEEYLSALVDAGKVRLGEVSVYTYESEEKVKEVEKE